MSLLFFDSGVGGLSVLDHVRASLPGAAVTYVADSAGFPYSTKSDAFLATRIPALLGRLVERFRPALVVIPCNTASVTALGEVRAALDVPVVGTVPAIKPAAASTRTGVMGVLGTEATMRQPYIDRLVAQFAPDKTVLRHGSTALVHAAEAKLRGRPVDPAAAPDVVAALRGQPGGEAMDTLVLACTHFPFLADELAAAAPKVALVDSGAGIARRVVTLTGGDVARGPGRAVFTRLDGEADTLRPALAARGLMTVEAL